MQRPSFLLFAVLVGTNGLLGPALAQDAPPLLPDQKGVIFQIGTQDKSRDEFRYGSWRGIDEYNCMAGVDCDEASFPARLTAAYAANVNDGISVERAIVSFNIAEEQSNLVFIVARFGIEKSVVRFDSNAPITVTHEMMDPPSKEDEWGRFALPLGTAAAGKHEIELSVLNEEAGTGRHSLDAIILISAD